MKKVTCIGYHDSGSGAVDDYLREFDGVRFAPSEVECRFLQDPYGISDLEYNLVENWHRLNSGFAIKKYEKFVKQNKRTYKLIFGEAWLRESERYVDSLIDFVFPGYWHADINEQPLHKWLIFKARRGLSKLLPKNLRKSQGYNYFPELVNYHSCLSEQDFYSNTQKYCENLCAALSGSASEIVVLDQCVSTTNIGRYLNYISDMKVIIVDRDPRDIYIQGTRAGEHVLPHDPQLFSKQFIDMRKSEHWETSNPNVLKVQFEDLIYKYDETTKIIRKFVGLDEKQHRNPRKFFNPEISVHNTQIWKKDHRFSEQLKIFDRELSDYYYAFEGEDYHD